MIEKPKVSELSGDARLVMDSIFKLVADSVMEHGSEADTVIGCLPGAPRLTAEAIVEALPSLVDGGYFEIAYNEKTDQVGLQPTDRGRRVTGIANEIISWMAGGLRAERPVGTKMHEFRAAYDANTLANVTLKSTSAAPFLREWETVHVFVVEHDWRSAFAGADIGDIEERKTPYPLCCFELVISGRRVCAFFDEADGGYLIAVEFLSGWSLINAELNFLNYLGIDTENLLGVIAEQVDAILIALDSGVATTEVVRAPAALNKARARRRKLPISDYHAVKLSRRSRPEPLPSGPGQADRAGPRLHFRRGHWRHLPSHKVWINWTLVGDPDLGFIDKHYRL